MYLLESFHGGSDDEESDCNAGRPRFNSWVEKIPWRREWKHTLGSLPRESHGQRSLAGYSPQGCKESDRTEQLTHTALPELQIFNILPLVLILSFLPSLSVQIIFGHLFPDNEVGHLLYATRIYFYARL